MRDLTGRTAILTGASHGIGPYIARALCDEGMNVALVARTAGSLEKLAGELGASGSRAIAIPADLGDRPSLDRVVDTATRTTAPTRHTIRSSGCVAVPGRIVGEATSRSSGARPAHPPLGSGTSFSRGVASSKEAVGAVRSSPHSRDGGEGPVRKGARCRNERAHTTLFRG